ncbi:hypothetical protein IKT64_02890 [Candidatus Saccharibacteria bacterium]|nr:hypothetical protein [Candidatus Saccharibacteria bacterium]
MKIGKNVKVFVVGLDKEECEEFIDDIMKAFIYMKGDYAPELLEELHVRKTGRQISDLEGNTLKFYPAVTEAGSEKSVNAYYDKAISHDVASRLDGLPYFGLHRRDFSERVLIVSLLNTMSYNVLNRVLKDNRDELMPYMLLESEELKHLYCVAADGISYKHTYKLETSSLLDGWSYSHQEASMSARILDNDFCGCYFYNAAMLTIVHCLPNAQYCQRMAHIFFLSSLLLATKVEETESTTT